MERELKINTEVISVNDIIPAEYNPRVTTHRGIYHLEKSLGRFGYVDPIIVNKKTMKLVGGHQRFSVLVRSGVSEIECVVVNLSEEKEKALNIALNKTSEHFEWDVTKLNVMLGEFDEDTLDSIGFHEEEIVTDMEDLLEDEISHDIEDSKVDKSKKFVSCPNCGEEVPRKEKTDDK